MPNRTDLHESFLSPMHFRLYPRHNDLAAPDQLLLSLRLMRVLVGIWELVTCQLCRLTRQSVKEVFSPVSDIGLSLFSWKRLSPNFQGFTLQPQHHSELRQQYIVSRILLSVLDPEFSQDLATMVHRFSKDTHGSLFLLMGHNGSWCLGVSLRLRGPCRTFVRCSDSLII